MKEYKLEKVRMTIEDQLEDLKRGDIEDFNKYKADLLRRLRLKEAQVKDAYNGMNDAQIKIDKARNREYSSSQVSAIITGSALTGAIGLGLFTSGIEGNIADAPFGAIAGGLAGGVAGVVLGALTEKKPFTQAYYSVKKHMLSKRLNRLNEKVYPDLYARKLLQNEGQLQTNGEELIFEEGFEK
jgi:hypothetical protein